MPPYKRAGTDILDGEGPLAKKQQIPVEKHDSTFAPPLILFRNFPINDTFDEFRITKVTSIPADDPTSSTFTFSYSGTSFGLIKTNEATLEADLTIVDTAANNAAFAANYNVGIIPFPLRTIWKSKEILINDVMVNTITNQDHIIAWVRHITTEVKTDFIASKELTLGEHDTPGYFDSVYLAGTADNADEEHQGLNYLTTTGTEPTHTVGVVSAAATNAATVTAGEVQTNANEWKYWPKVGMLNGKPVGNVGLRNRSRLLETEANAEHKYRLIDTLDTVCFNENGTDKYFPSDFNIKVILHKNSPNKFIRGYIGATAANTARGVNTADVALNNFVLNLPMYKPKDQLAAAINKTMVTNEEECRFYTTHYRLVTRQVAGNANQIQQNDIFTGTRPMRVYHSLITQARWNGGFGHYPPAVGVDATNNNGAGAGQAQRRNLVLPPENVMANITDTSHTAGTLDNTLIRARNHPLRAPLMDFTYSCLRVNSGIIAEYRNRKQAYWEFLRALNRLNREPPFDYRAYLSDYGWLLFDLSQNKDSFNEILPNATSGNVSYECTLTANLANVPWVALFVAEFRNEVRIGVNTAPRKIYDY